MSIALFLVSPLCWFHGIVALIYIVEAFFSALTGYLCWRACSGEKAFLVPASMAFALAAGFRAFLYRAVARPALAVYGLAGAWNPADPGDLGGAGRDVRLVPSYDCRSRRPAPVFRGARASVGNRSGPQDHPVFAVARHRQNSHHGLDFRADSWTRHCLRGRAKDRISIRTGPPGRICLGLGGSRRTVFCLCVPQLCQ